MKKASKSAYLLGLSLLVGVLTLCIVNVVNGNISITIPMIEKLHKPTLHDLYLGNSTTSTYIIVNDENFKIQNGLIMGDNNMVNAGSSFVSIGGGSNNTIGVQPQSEDLVESGGDSSGESDDEVVDSEDSVTNEENSTDEESGEEGNGVEDDEVVDSEDSVIDEENSMDEENGEEVDGDQENDEIVVNNNWVMVEKSGIGGGKDNMIITSFSVIGGGKNNSTVSGSLNTIAGGSNNQAGEGGTVVGGDDNIANGMGIIIGGKGNRLEGDGMVMGSNSKGGIGSFSWNSSLTQNYSAIIMANKGVLVGTTDPITGVNLVVDGAIKIGAATTDGNVGEIKMQDGCFYGFNGNSWHLINKAPGNNCPGTMTCAFGSILLQDGDHVQAYTQPYAQDCSQVITEVVCHSDGTLGTSSDGDVYPYCRDMGKPECGIAISSVHMQEPTIDDGLCAYGNPSSVEASDTKYTWSCTFGDESVYCSADRKYDCGSDVPGPYGVDRGPRYYDNGYTGLTGWTYQTGTSSLGACEWRCKYGYYRVEGTNECEICTGQCLNDPSRYLSDSLCSSGGDMFDNKYTYHIKRIRGANGPELEKKLYRTEAEARQHSCSYVCTNGYKFLPASGDKSDRCVKCRWGSEVYGANGDLVSCREVIDICGKHYQYSPEKSKSKCVAIGNCIWGADALNVKPDNTDINNTGNLKNSRPKGEDKKWTCTNNPQGYACQYSCDDGYVCREDGDPAGPGCSRVYCYNFGGNKTMPKIERPVRKDTYGYSYNRPRTYYQYRTFLSVTGAEGFWDQVGSSDGCIFWCSADNLCKYYNGCYTSDPNYWTCYADANEKKNKCTVRSSCGGTSSCKSCAGKNYTLKGYTTSSECGSSENQTFQTYTGAGEYLDHRSEGCYEGCQEGTTYIEDERFGKVCWKQCPSGQYLDLRPGGGCRSCGSNLKMINSDENTWLNGVPTSCVYKCPTGRTWGEDYGPDGGEGCIPTEMDKACDEGYSIEIIDGEYKCVKDVDPDSDGPEA